MLGEKIISNCDNQILYISDEEDKCQELMSKGLPVAALLHDGNRNASFSGIKYIIEDMDELEDSDYEHIFRRIKGLPCFILETKNLIVRETTVDDVDSFVGLYEDSSITKYMEDLFPYEEEKKYQQNYIDMVYSFYDCGIWSLILKETGEVIGRMGVEITEEEGVADLGFMLGKAYQKHGYALEAGKAILEYAFTIDGITSVRARIHPDNKESIKLCERLGMNYNHTKDEMLVYCCSTNVNKL